MSTNRVHPIRSIVVSALFAASMAAGAIIIIPIGIVPITLQTLFVLLAGLLGGPRIALTSTAAYLLLGTMGLPVFSGGIGGIAHFASPTGGFLIGLFFMAAVAGAFSWLSERIARSRGVRLVIVSFGVLCASVVLYAIGLPLLRVRLGLDWTKTFAVGLLPFIPGDIIKCIASVVLYDLFRKKISTFLCLRWGESDYELP